MAANADAAAGMLAAPPPGTINAATDEAAAKKEQKAAEVKAKADAKEKAAGARTEWVPSFAANSITKMVDKATHKGAVEAIDYIITSTCGPAAARLECRPCGFILLTGSCRSAADPSINCLNCAAHKLMSPPGCDVVAVPPGAVAKVKAACIAKLAAQIKG